MRLWIKGYGFSEQNILLRLDKSWLNEYLELDSALDLETWDTDVYKRQMPKSWKWINIMDIY